MKYILLLSIISTIISAEEIPKEDNVYVLKEKTFDEFIKTHDHVLVKFYAPWCGHCKRLAPEYSKAAAILEKENIFLAQVDATVERSLGGRFNVGGYPTLKYFKKGEANEYKGGRKEKEIINWMKKRATGELLKNLTNQKELDEYKSKNEVLIVYFGDNKDDLKVLEKIANDYDDHTFAIINDQNSMNENGVKPRTIKLFKNFEDKFNIMEGEINEKNILSFAYGYSFPALMRLEPKAIPRSFHKKRGCLVLFRHDDDKNVKELDDIFAKVAEKVRMIIPVLYSDTKADYEKELVDYINVKVDNLPVVKIADTRSKIKKYTFTGKMDVDEIVKFVMDWSENKLKDDDTIKKEEDKKKAEEKKKEDKKKEEPKKEDKKVDDKKTDL